MHIRITKSATTSTTTTATTLSPLNNLWKQLVATVIMKAEVMATRVAQEEDETRNFTQFHIGVASMPVQ